jgi:hypothetical protein
MQIDNIRDFAVHYVVRVRVRRVASRRRFAALDLFGMRRNEYARTSMNNR